MDLKEKSKLEDKIQKKVEELGEIPMSDADIRRYLPDVRIIKYADLSKYSSIESLLPKPRDGLVILYESQPNSGHWVALCRYPKKTRSDIEKQESVYCYFDSYGNDIDVPLKWNSPRQNMLLGQEKHYLRDLLSTSSSTPKYIYSNTKYQPMSSDKTLDHNECGRFVTFFLMSILEKRMTLEDFQTMMEKLKKSFSKSYCEVVTFLINK